MRTIGSPSLSAASSGSTWSTGSGIMVFPTIHGTTGEGPVFADLPDVTLDLVGTTVLDDRLVLLDYRVGERLQPRTDDQAGQ